MTDESTDGVSVLYVDSPAERASDRASELAVAADGLDVAAVATADDALSRLTDGGADCVVAAGSASDDCSLVERLADAQSDVPVVVFGAPTATDPDTAFDAGADGYVADVGPDSVRVLANRVRSAVEHASAVDAKRTVENRFQALTENTDFAVVAVDADSRIQYASPAIEGLLGYGVGDLVGESLTTIIPDRLVESHLDGVERYLETGERTLDWSWIELPGEHAAGHEVPLGITFGEYEDDDERVFTALLRDVRDKAEREERLERLAAAVEGSMDGMAILDAEGTYKFVNDAHAEIYGYSERGELLGESWRVHYGPAETERFEREIMPTFREAGQWRGEATGRRADGTTFPQEVSLTEIDEGWIVCVVRDITERVTQRERLAEQQQFTESVLNTLSDVLYVLDVDGSLRRWNDRMNEVSGYTDDELDGMSALELIPPDDQVEIAEAIQSVFQNDETEARRTDLVTKGGDRIPYELNGTRLTDGEGELVGLVGIGRDVSDEELREQRLSVLSRVLRHNVRNQMTVVEGNAQYLAERIDDPDLEGKLAEIKTAAEAIVQLSNRARSMESLLREDQPTRQEVDLVEVVEAGLAAVEADTEGLDLRTALPDSAPAVTAETVHLAVAEVVENAIRHVTDPTIRVAVATVDDTVEIRVADDGDGIPEYEREVLTSGPETQLDHSTGIGLWLVNWLVTATGGEVQFRESDWGGSVVVLAFPAT